MIKKSYIPDRGDVVWLNFDNTKGHEQSGRRPALVISSKIYNSKSGLSLVCPITSVSKNYPFEVSLELREINGVALADQLRTVDWRQRKAEYVSCVDEIVVKKIQHKISELVTG